VSNRGDSNDREFDLFVIGAGSGGMRAARISSGYGGVMIAENAASAAPA
jgi:glutathione reductase (NADPH)